MADDVASLGFAVDSSQLVAASAALDKVNASAQRLAPSQASVVNASQRLSNEQKLAIASSRAVTVAQAELGDKVELLSRNTDLAYRSLSTRSFFRLMAREAGMVGGPLGQMIGHFGILTVGGQRLGGVVTGVTIVFAAFVAVIAAGIAKFAELEKIQERVQAALDLTRIASGQNVIGLERMAQRMADTGNVSLTSIREAQAELLRFKTVGTQSFESVLEISKKVALTGFADMKTAAKVLGEALKDPGTAMDRLKEIMITLTAAQQAEIDKALRNGDIMKAQALILQAAGAATKGVTDASNGLSAAWERLHNSFFGRLIQIGEIAANFLRLRDAMNAIADTIRSGFGGGEPTRITVNPARGGISAAEEARLENQRRLQKAAADVNFELDKQLRVAGKSAVQLEQYNQTVEKNIAVETQEAAAIRAKVNAIASINETRRVTDQIKLNTAELRIETATMLMATGPAAEYKAVQEALAQARIKNITLSPEQVAKIKQEAAALGDATAAAERMRQAIDLTGTFASGFFTDLSHGVSKIDALRNALTRLSDSLIDMATKQLVKAALGGLLGGASSGGSLLGFLGLGGAKVATGHTGGIVGSLTGSRYIHPAYFDNAPRFGSGGLVGGEVPLIAHAGEGIFTPAQMAAMGRGGGAPSVVQHFYLDGAMTKNDVVSMVKEGARSAVMQSTGYTNAALKQADRSMSSRQSQKRLLEG